MTLREDVLVGTAFWAYDDTIVFQPATGKGLQRIAGSGGSPVSLLGFESGAKDEICLSCKCPPGHRGVNKR